MPVGPETSFGWQEAAIAFTMIAVVAFLVTWVVTDLGHVSRTPYVAILTLVSLGLGAGYLAWSGTSLADLVTPGWGLGILAGVIAAVVVVPGVRRLPRGPRAEGAQLAGRLLWEGGVYGIAEAILLATLPVLAVWQTAVALGWTDTIWAEIGSGALAVAGALLVIALHHLGYREFRGRAAKPKLTGALVACGVQALAFLVTGNVIAPVVAHILLHAQLITRGTALPPASSGEPSSRAAHPGVVTEPPAPRRDRVASRG
jgi:hypothetical protein